MRRNAMFGRRNLDNQLVLPSERAEGELNLDVLPDLLDEPDSPASTTVSQQPSEELLAELERTYATPAHIPLPPANQLAGSSSPVDNSPTPPAVALDISASPSKAANETVIGPDDFFD